MSAGKLGPDDSGENFDAMFDMMMNHRQTEPAKTPISCHDQASPPVCKRPRCDEQESLLAEKISMQSPCDHAAKNTGDAENSVVALRPGGAQAPPPEKVALAYALLQLPLNSSAPDIVRQWRRLARRAHPDKVSPDPDFFEEKELAVKHFQELQEAKETVLRWLLGTLGGESGDGDFDANTSDDDLGGSSDGSGDSNCEAEGLAELKVCGIDTGRDGSESPPDQDASDDGFDDCILGGDFGVAAAAAAATCRGSSGQAQFDAGIGVKVGLTGLEKVGGADVAPDISCLDSVLEQAAALSSSVTTNAGLNSGVTTTCFECLQRTPVGSDGMCVRCRREAKELWKSLSK